MRNPFDRLRAWWRGPAPAPKRKRSISALAMLGLGGEDRTPHPVTMPTLPPGVIPDAARADTDYMALDRNGAAMCTYANGEYCGFGFPGYPLLSEYMQRSEYRAPSETTAQEMTRAWIRIRAIGDGDLSAKIERIEAELKRHKVREVFRKAAMHDGFFGRAQIYIDIEPQSMAADVVRMLPLMIDPAAIKKGSLNGFKNIEPIWTTPYQYNTSDPTAKDFYKPTVWFVLGKQTHATRLLTIISREVPDILKPAYNFGGISMSQMMQPYVDAWLRTRDSVSDLVHSFSTSGIKTDMSDVLSGGGAEMLVKRAELFNKTRDNRGLMMLDNSDAAAVEEFFQFNTPLSGLDKLQAQSQEHMAAPSHLPLVKLLGIVPAGLNATAEGEIDVWYDHVHAMQEAIFTDPLNTVIQVIQLDCFGEIDPAIGFEYVPLKQLDGEQLANVRKADAEAATGYITAGVISPSEERARLAADPNSGYDSLAEEDAPELPDDDTKPQGELDD